MEVKYILIYFGIITAGIALLIMFVGCNMEESIEEKCGVYPTTRSPGQLVSQYDKCTNKHISKESICSNVLWWMKY